jgi:hypothetical protein
MFSLFFFYALSYPGAMPVDVIAPNKVLITGLNDSSLRIEIDNAFFWTQPSISLKKAQLNALLGLEAVWPSIRFAIRLGYPKRGLGFFIVNLGDDALLPLGLHQLLNQWFPTASSTGVSPTTIPGIPWQGE